MKKIVCHRFKRNKNTVANVFKAALIASIISVSSFTQASSLINQRAMHSVQLLDNIRAGAMAYYAKNHDLSYMCEVAIKLLSCSDREYLDAFGNYFEPFEYQQPKGIVAGICFNIGNQSNLPDIKSWTDAKKQLKRRINLILFIL